MSDKCCQKCFHWNPYSEPAPQLGPDIAHTFGGHREEPIEGPRGFTMRFYRCALFLSRKTGDD